MELDMVQCEVLNSPAVFITNFLTPDDPEAGPFDPHMSKHSKSKGTFLP